MVCSIFMASITISASPAATCAPTATGTATTTPGSGVVSPPLATLAVDGRYVALGNTFPEILKNTDALVAEARAEHAAAPKPAAKKGK